MRPIDLFWVNLLQMNDFVRDKLRLESGVVPLHAEIIAGGTVSRSPQHHHPVWKTPTPLPPSVV